MPSADDLTELQKWVLEQVAAGFTVEQLTVVPNAPSLSDVRRWIRDNKDFEDCYKESLKARHVLQFERLFSAANELMQVKKDFPADYVHRLKTASDILDKVAAKLIPGRFGAKLDVEHSTPKDKSLNLKVDFVTSPFEEEKKGEDSDVKYT